MQLNMTAKGVHLDDRSLADRLRERIRTSGPISFYEWMRAALYDEREGYYCRSDRVRWGREGDYRTAPERSPLFAATFARYFARLFAEINTPSRTIFEAGAGSGVFARGALEYLAKHHPRVVKATRYVIDEISSASCRTIEERLADFRDRFEFRSLDSLTEPI